MAVAVDHDSPGRGRPQVSSEITSTPAGRFASAMSPPPTSATVPAVRPPWHALAAMAAVMLAGAVFVARAPSRPRGEAAGSPAA
jgi:hypothetical protein